MKVSFNRPRATSAYGGGAHFVTNFSNYLEKAWVIMYVTV